MILVRLLLFLALAAIAVAAVMYLFSKDRRYLRFIWQVVKFTVVILAVVLVFFAFERIVGPMLCGAASTGGRAQARPGGRREHSERGGCPLSPRAAESDPARS